MSRISSFLDILADPTSGQPFKVDGSFLANGACHFPVLAGTPVLVGDPMEFLLSNWVHVQRMSHEFGFDLKPFDIPWHEAGFVPEEGTAIDTEIIGEGYPGVWEELPVPEFVRPLLQNDALTVIPSLLHTRFRGLGLDLGCGQGAMTQIMAQMCERVIGVDHQIYLTGLANQLLPSPEISVPYFDPLGGWETLKISKPAAENALVVCADVMNLPFAEPLFDWIHCGHIVDLLDQPEDLLQQLIRLLKPGSVLSVASPHDFPNRGHLDDFKDSLESHFETVHEQDEVPYLRWNHARRFVVHSDWIWIGKLN